MKLDLDRRISAFAQLSDFLFAVADQNRQSVDKHLLPLYDSFTNLVENLTDYNPWFIKEFVLYQLKAIAQATTLENLEKWLSPYKDRLESDRKVRTIAVIMAGNIPFVGFSDFIAVLMAGHKFLGKLSSKDTHLPRAVAEVLIQIEPMFKDYIFLTDQVISGLNFDAVLATGSDNSARYFEYYFAKYPKIIRKNRTSVAVLTGQEDDEQLQALAGDVFLYFGLGCRNVSKIFLPEHFDLNRLFKAFYKYRFVIENSKYANNYDYNRAVYLLNKEKFYDNGFIMLKPEDIALVSPTAVLFYQNYTNLNTVKSILEAYRDKIQCVVSTVKFQGFDVVGFGQSQIPMLWQYPDNIDVMEFLLNLP